MKHNAYACQLLLLCKQVHYAYMEETLKFPDPYWRAYDTKLTSRTEELYSKQTKI